MFSCYRRDEAQDPEGFVANLAMVLGDYPAEIVDLAADPRTGIITAFPMGLPNVGQIKQFLDDKLSHQTNLKRLAALPKFERVPRPARMPKPGDLANVLVRGALDKNGVPTSDSHRLYGKFLEKAKDADPREFEIVPEGIRVALSWLEDPADSLKNRFKKPAVSDDELRKMYAKPEEPEVFITKEQWDEIPGEGGGEPRCQSSGWSR